MKKLHFLAWAFIIAIGFTSCNDVMKDPNATGCQELHYGAFTPQQKIDLANNGFDIDSRIEYNALTQAQKVAFKSNGLDTTVSCYTIVDP